jgi:hypothetical protein
LRRRRDDGFEKGGEEGGFGSELGPDDGCRYRGDGEEEREPTETGVGELVWRFGPLRERVGVDAYLEIFSEDGDVFAKVEAAAELGYGCVALG